MKNFRQMRVKQIAHELDAICDCLNKRLANLRKDLEGELRPNYCLCIKQSNRLLNAFRANYDRLKAIDRKYKIYSMSVDFYGCQLAAHEEYWAYYE